MTNSLSSAPLGAPTVDALPVAMYENGFTDLISAVPPGATISPGSKLKPSMLGKCPGRRNKNGTWAGYPWQKAEHSIDDVRQWMIDGANVGLRADRFPGLDIDSEDPALVEFIEALAIATLGPAPVRYGRRPKLLLMYATPKGFGRLRAWATRGEPGTDEYEKHLVEILGTGQQYLVYGIHPSGANYEWTQDMREVLPDSLTEITKQDALAFRDVLAEHLREFGYSVEYEGDGKPASQATQDQLALRAPSLDVIYEAVKCIPNDNENFGGREDWLKMGYAIKAAFGMENEHEARELFLEWSLKWSGNDSHPEGNKADQVLEEFRRLVPPYKVGWPFLAETARGFGFNDADSVFDALDPALETVGQTDVVALPTRIERIAALTHDAGAALLYVADTIADGEILTQWATLERAENTVDPLESLFRSVVISATPGYRGYRRPQFRSLLDAKLRANAAWGALDHEDRETLLDAAFVFINGGASSKASTPRSVPLSSDPAPADDLVAGLIPKPGLVGLLGQPNTGKSFLAGDLDGRVASDAGTFAGLSIRHHGPVLSFTSEDVFGFRDRLPRWSAEHKLSLDRLYLFDGVPPLADCGAAITYVMDAVSQVGLTEPPALITIDTFRDALGSEDENDAGAVANACRVARLLSRMFGACVLLVHHAGHGDPARERGSSAFGASVDVKLSVQQEGNTVTATVQKNRRGPKGQKYQWHLRPVSGGVVLFDGPATHDGLGAGITQSDQDAHLAGELIRQIASPAHPASLKQLNDALAANCTGMQDDPNVRNRSASTRRSRAVQRAIDLGFVAVNGAGRSRTYVPGRIAPPSPPELPSLEDVT